MNSTGNGNPQLPATSDEAASDDLPEAAKQEIEHELSLLDPPTRATIRPALIRVARTVMFAGPLPPPSMLREYSEIIDDGANRIFAMAEKEQAARHRNEGREHRAGMSGLIFGFVVSLGLIGGAIICAVLGQTVGMGLFLGAGAISMVPALIRGREFFGGGKDEAE